MPLDPDLEGFVDLVEFGRLSGKQRPLHELTIAEARAAFARSAAVLEGGPGRSVWVDQIRVPTRDGAEIAARLYAAAMPSPASPLPCLLFLHGGGYVVGDLDSHDGLCRDLAHRSRWAILSLAYRLAPEHRFPTALHDALDAVHWLAGHGASLSLDPCRLVVAGDSVGGSLAAVLAIVAAREPAIMPLTPMLQLLIYPVTDALGDYPSRTRYAEGYLLETASLEWFYGHYQNEPADRYDWRFSPLRAPDLLGVSPALLLLAEFDPLLDEGLAYGQRLRPNDVPVEVDVRPGMTHDFLRMVGVTAEADRMRGRVVERLGQLK